MSGAIEIVGFSLAVFPLVISLLEHYQDGYESLQDWIFFRREFTQIVNELHREQILFRQQIESMLCSITDSGFDMKGMMEDVQSDRWKNPELNARLKKKLCGDGEFENYYSSLQSIHANLEKMAKKLKACEPPDESLSITPQKGRQFQKRFRKLQFSLRKKKWQEQVVDLGRQIDRVGRLLGEAEALAPARQSRSSTAFQAFEQVKSQASSLHKAITKSWTCGCTKDHSFKLVLAKRSKSSGSQRPSSRALKVSFPLRPSMWTRVGTLLDSSDEWYASDTTMILPSDKSDASIANGKEAKSYSDYSISGSSSVPSLSSIIVTATSTATIVTSEFRSHDAPLQKNRSDQKESVPSVLTPDPPISISDLCHTIRARRKEACLGHLEDGQGSYHIFHSSQSFSFASGEIARVISLGAILDKEAQQNTQLNLDLSRRDRLSIALTLAYALLELYPTPWLPRIWGKTNVYFFQRKNGELLTENPFVLRKAMPTSEHSWIKSSTSDTSIHDHSDALLSLGILIMELWFGETIETRSSWKEHCDNDGNAKELTRFMAAIEWQKRAIGEGGVTLHEITHRCIRGNFGPTTMNLDDERCVGAVYDGVVKPLESLLGYFWPGQGLT